MLNMSSLGFIDDDDDDDKSILVSVRWKARDVFLVYNQKLFYLQWKQRRVFFLTFSFIPVLEVSCGDKRGRGSAPQISSLIDEV